MANLQAIAKQACNEAMRAGAQFADVGLSRGKSLSIELERGRIKSSDARWGSGCSVRAIINGAVGWSSAPGADLDAALQAARLAVELAEVADPDPDFRQLPGPASGPDVGPTADPRVAQLTIGDLVDFCLMNVESAQEVEPSVVVSGGASTGWDESVLVNSCGVDLYRESTSVNASVQAIIRRGDDVGSFYDYDVARFLEDFVPEGLGAKAAKEALSCLNARKIGSGVMTVVLGPLASPSLAGSVCYAAVAEEVQRSRSFLAGKLGQRIASEHVTLIDNPLIPRGLATSAFDGEGVPRKPLTIVESGVLRSYLHDTYTAGKAGVESTGHSTRGGISPTNVIPKLGTMTAAEIIAGVEDGLYLNDSFAYPNMVTGDLSTTVEFGFRIEGGKLTYPVKNTMFGANLLDMLMNLDAVSSDYREEPGRIMPTVRVHNVRVAGGA